MYTILLPVDDDERRTDGQVSFLTEYPTAHDSDVEVYVTHVLRGAEREAPEAMRNPGRVATVKRAVETLEGEGFSVTVTEAPAPPEEGIVSLAADIDADHIVMGGRKRSPAGKALFGSVTQSVVLETDVPVTVTGADEE